jgi:hypothetical protein
MPCATNCRLTRSLSLSASISYDLAEFDLAEFDLKPYPSLEATVLWDTSGVRPCYGLRRDIIKAAWVSGGLYSSCLSEIPPSESEANRVVGTRIRAVISATLLQIGPARGCTNIISYVQSTARMSLSNGASAIDKEHVIPEGTGMHSMYR